MTESSKAHPHTHTPPTSPVLTYRFKNPNPHRTPDPSERLARLFLFLEAQFGADSVSPIPIPRNSASNADGNPTTPSLPTQSSEPFSVAALPPPPDLSPADKQELKRLHNLGIPVPGIEIKFDKHVAKVWLEDLEVECASAALKARVKAVVERGVETVSGLWA